MSLVKTIDLGSLTKTIVLSVISTNGISNLYELSGNNTTSRTQTYEINGNEINDVIKSNTDHIVLKFNVYPHSLDNANETASCVVDNDTVFYIEKQYFSTSYFRTLVKNRNSLKISKLFKLFGLGVRFRIK